MPSKPYTDLVNRTVCDRASIEWKPACLDLFRDDPRLQSFTEKGIKDLLWDFVRNQRGRLEAKKETDPYWLEKRPDDPWWYSIVIPVPQFKHGLFVKVRLLWEEGDPEDEASVQIISIHEEIK